MSLHVFTILNLKIQFELYTCVIYDQTGINLMRLGTLLASFANPFLLYRVSI